MRVGTWFTLLVGVAGCLGETEETVETGETETEIVGGAITTARREIGQYFNGGGGACTATLIGPSLVVTAAHCLVPQYTATMPPIGANFRFLDLTGVTRTVPVDRVHSFATKRFERPFPGSRFTTDVALLHLQTPVPSWQALPAATAVQEPTIGALSSIFGFGCTSRDPQIQDGLKRVFTFTYGNETRAVCWGDSGGPVVFGDLTSAGAVWGVNSDFDWTFPNWFANSWLDLFANVPMYRKQMEDVARGWQAGLEDGMDRFGFDYFVELVPSAAACKTGCERDGNCRAFTWRSSTQHCWRKSAASEPTPAAGLVSGLPSRNEPGVDRWGYDYAALNITTPDACAAACGRDASCQSWTQLNQSCWLKGAIAPAVVGSCPGCTSGVVRRGLEINIDRPGNTFIVAFANTALECSSLCARTASCESFTHQGFSCSLKDSVPNAVAVSAGAFMTSGVRRGVETNSDRPGGTYRTFTTTNLSPTACQAACASEVPCQAWSYTPPAPTGSVASCALKSSVPQRQLANGMVSGIKGLEMLP